MGAQILNGRELAKRVRGEVAERAAALKAAGTTPCLAVILAGDDPASHVYVRAKHRAAERAGVATRDLRFDADVEISELEAAVDALNADPAVHGILIQLPLPSSIDPARGRALLERLDPSKDVDGLHPMNLGALVAGQPGFVACTPSGCMKLIAESGIELQGKRAVVLGRSLLVGKPMVQLLTAANATVTQCHSRTVDLPERCREADVLVVAVGRPKLVQADWVKPGAVVIDVGINRTEEGGLVGDVDFEAVGEHAGWLTPVPRGVGPMTIACLMENVVLSAERSSAQ